MHMLRADTLGSFRPREGCEMNHDMGDFYTNYIGFRPREGCEMNLDENLEIVTAK